MLNLDLVVFLNVFSNKYTFFNLKSSCVPGGIFTTGTYVVPGQLVPQHWWDIPCPPSKSPSESGGKKLGKFT